MVNDQYFENLSANGGVALDWGGSSVIVGLPISFAAYSNAATTRTNLGLGATKNVTFSNITASGTLGVSNAATFATNVSVAGSLTATGNATLSGVGNTAPQQTADSGSSLMTRDLVGQELANPRNKMQTTYWFGLEGLGLWQTVNGANASLVGNRFPRWGGSLAVFGNTTNNRSAVTAAGFGLRLGANSVTGVGAWRPSDGGAFVLRTHIVNYFGNNSQAFGFYMGAPANTNFWGNSEAVGIWCVAQPTNSWASNTAFVQHTRIAVSNIVWTVSTAGTTDTNEPTWTDLINSTVTNGTAVFRNLGPHTSNNWVLARGSTNASEVVMTNTGKSNWARPTVQEALLQLRYGTNTTVPYTYYATVTDGAGESAEVSIDGLSNNAISPQYWGRWDSTNAVVGNDNFGIRYFSIDAELPPLTTP
jgi:hypothetical protein